MKSIMRILGCNQPNENINEILKDYKSEPIFHILIIMIRRDRFSKKSTNYNI